MEGLIESVFHDLNGVIESPLEEFVLGVLSFEIWEHILALKWDLNEGKALVFHGFLKLGLFLELLGLLLSLSLTCRIFDLHLEYAEKLVLKFKIDYFE